MSASVFRIRTGSGSRGLKRAEKEAKKASKRQIIRKKIYKKQTMYVIGLK
jgi:hypothetical protein